MKNNIKNSLIVGFQKTQVKCFGPWSLHKCPQDLGWGREGEFCAQVSRVPKYVGL